MRAAGSVETKEDILEWGFVGKRHDRRETFIDVGLKGTQKNIDDNNDDS